MDKNAIKKYAVWARTELIERVTQKAQQYEISADADPQADAVHGKLLSKDEKDQRAKLISKVKEKGYEQIMEEVAYTWFNRFSALRFMEVNNYLPSRVRVFTDANGAFKPQILTEAIHMELKGLNMEKVYALKEANDDEELFKYLIITQCNDLSEVLPGMFQKISDYTELLFPDNLLRDGSVIEKMVVQGQSDSIPEKDWDVSEGGQIEILGWLYQYYITEKHESVVDPLHGKVVAKEEVPAATALFTTDWVVRYIIDNSVGRYWIERNPESKLKDELEYFVTPKDGKVSTVDEKITPEQLTVFDPCMGSAHFGVYAFDVLEKIYTEYGFNERDAAASIVQNNLFGLDIDDRSAQIAYFAIMMKAMQYDKRFLHRGIQPLFYSIQEGNNIDSYTIDYFAKGDAGLKKDIKSIVDVFKDAKEYGSILQIAPVNFSALYARFEEIRLGVDISMYTQTSLNQLLPLVEVAEVMSRKYAVVATNPPYLNKYDAPLKKYVNDNYNDYSGDLFSVFMYRNFSFCKVDGYLGFLTPNVWMSTKSYQALREYIMSQKSVISLVQMAHGAFNEVACVDVCAFILKNSQEKMNGMYIKLSEFKGNMDEQGGKCLDAVNDTSCSYRFEANNSDLMSVPTSPITAFCASQNLLNIYKNSALLGDVADPKQGIATSDNDRFLRQWFEVKIDNVFLDCSSHDESLKSLRRWYPYNKGGNFRKWYGNNDFLVDWESDGKRLKSFKGAVLRNPSFYFRECISWSLISSYTIAFRYKPIGQLFDVAGMSCFSNGSIPLLYLLGLTNSCLIGKIMLILAPTINYQVGNIANIPVVYDKSKAQEIIEIVKQNIQLARDDWNSYETSWEFVREPLCSSVYKSSRIYEVYQDVKKSTNELFNKLHRNEEKLNEMFLEIYQAVGEISKTVSRRDVSHTYIYDKKDEIIEDIKESYYVRTQVDLIRNLISYAVGCMFGRYSLDVDGLAYAGGEWDVSKYQTFSADKDNIIPICDDEYFEDDIVNRFVKFIEVVYGKDTLEENLKFISDALGGKGAPREVIRKYFLNDFFKDHCKTYRKRPIYWLFDSGKKNGFKCLIYMHRYQPDTIARIRTDYVHEQQARYRTAIEGLERQLNDASTSERVKINKQLTKLKDQAEETRKFEEKIHHLADQMIKIDLDDGVKHNYEIFKDVLAKIK